MTDTTMLEKAARALAAEDARDRGVDLYAKNPGFYLRLARAVLMAVREPGCEVEARGWLVVDDLESETMLGEAFAAMIDAILADGEGR